MNVWNFFTTRAHWLKIKSDNLYQRVSAPVSFNKSPVQWHNLEPRVLRLFVNSWSPEEACALISCYTDNHSKAYCLKSMYSPRVKPAPIRWPQSPWARLRDWQWHLWLSFWKSFLFPAKIFRKSLILILRDGKYEWTLASCKVDCLCQTYYLVHPTCVTGS